MSGNLLFVGGKGKKGYHPSSGHMPLGQRVQKKRCRGRLGGGKGRLVMQQRPGAAVATRTCTAPGFVFLWGGVWRRRLAARVAMVASFAFGDRATTRLHAAFCGC